MTGRELRVRVGVSAGLIFLFSVWEGKHLGGRWEGGRRAGGKTYNGRGTGSRNL